MTNFCLLGDWVLPLAAVAGGIVISTVVGYGVWKFGVSPVKLENQQLSQFNQGLTQDLAVTAQNLTVTERWKQFYLDAYTREREAHMGIEAHYSIIRERLEALERNKKSRVSEMEGSCENVSLDPFKDQDPGSGCPLENCVIDIDPFYVAAIFDFFSWVLWATIFLLLAYLFRKVLWVWKSRLSIISYIVSTFSRKPVFGYLGTVYAMISIGVLGFIAWAYYTIEIENYFVLFVVVVFLLLALVLLGSKRKRIHRF